MAFRSSAIASSSTGGTITATPAGVVAHDYLCALYVNDTTGATLSPPLGWTQRVSLANALPDQQDGFIADKADATGSDAFGFSDSSATNPNALITAAWSGRNNAAPRTAIGTSTINTASNASPISASINGVTAVNGDDVALWQFTDQTAAAARWTYSTVAGYTEQQDGVNVDWVSGIALDTRDNVSAGATGALTSTITRGVGTLNAGYRGVTIAIAAAASGGSLPPQPQITLNPGGVPLGSVALAPGLVPNLGPVRWQNWESYPWSPTVAASKDIASAGVLTITGAASLASSVGTLAAAGALTITGAALLNATGTIAGAGTLLITGAAALTSTGTLASAGTLVIVGGATLTAQGTLAAAGTLVINGSASMPGLNDMVSAGNLTISAAAALTALGSLASAGTVSITGAAPLTSIGTLASAGTVVITGASNITAPSANDMAAAGTILITSSAELSAVGSLAASGALTILGAALLDDGAVVVTAQQNSGGWPIFAMEYERELSRRRKERARRLELEDEAEQIPEQVSREIAALLHEQEAKTAKRQELERLRDLAKELGAEEAERQLGQRVAAALSRAVEKGNYSALEALDREIARAQSDEEDWLLAVTMLLADD